MIPDKLVELGLKLTLDFITEAEEAELLSAIGPSNSKMSKQYLGRNSIRRYGSKLPYGSNVISETVPDFLDKFCVRLVEQGLVDSKPDSITVNEYQKGQFIAPHIDSIASGPVITVLSLMSRGVMVFSNGDEKISVTLEPRSVVQMSGAIRSQWKHATEPVESERYSVVFRLGTETKKVTVPSPR
jgi:alkylated DNA repair dioxygenase AlkB